MQLLRQGVQELFVYSLSDNYHGECFFKVIYRLAMRQLDMIGNSKLKV